MSKIRTTAMALMFTYLTSLPAAAQFGFEVEPPQKPPAVEAPVDEPQGELTTYKGIQYFKPDGLRDRSGIWVPDKTYTLIKGFLPEPEFRYAHRGAGMCVQVRVFPHKGQVAESTHLNYAKKTLRWLSKASQHASERSRAKVESYVRLKNIDDIVGTNGTIRGMPGHVYENPHPKRAIVYTMYDEENSRIIAVVGFSAYGAIIYQLASDLALDITASLSIH